MVAILWGAVAVLGFVALNDNIAQFGSDGNPAAGQRLVNESTMVD